MPIVAGGHSGPPLHARHYKPPENLGQIYRDGPANHSRSCTLPKHLQAVTAKLGAFPYKPPLVFGKDGAYTRRSSKNLGRSFCVSGCGLGSTFVVFRKYFGKVSEKFRKYPGNVSEMYPHNPANDRRVISRRRAAGCPFLPGPPDEKQKHDAATPPHLSSLESRNTKPLACRRNTNLQDPRDDFGNVCRASASTSKSYVPETNPLGVIESKS